MCKRINPGTSWNICKNQTKKKKKNNNKKMDRWKVGRKHLYTYYFRQTLFSHCEFSLKASTQLSFIGILLQLADMTLSSCIFLSPFCLVVIEKSPFQWIDKRDKWKLDFCHLLISNFVIAHKLFGSVCIQTDLMDFFSL